MLPVGNTAATQNGVSSLPDSGAVTVTRFPQLSIRTDGATVSDLVPVGRLVAKALQSTLVAPITMTVMVSIGGRREVSFGVNNAPARRSPRSAPDT